MILTPNETIFVLWMIGILLSAFFGAIIAILNKGVNKMEGMASSLNNMERDFKVLVNDHTNLKDDVKEIDKRVKDLEKKK